MSRKIVYLFLGAILIAALYLGFTSYRNDTGRMLTKFNSQLKEEKFEELYDESSETVHLNVTKEEFVRRMKVAVRKLKNIDQDLNFQTGEHIEREIFLAEEDNTYSFRSVQKLEKDNISAVISIYWQNSGIFPKFSDFNVITQSEYSEKYGTPGVSYNKINISNPENY